MRTYSAIVSGWGVCRTSSYETVSLWGRTFKQRTGRYNSVPQSTTWFTLLSYRGCGASFLDLVGHFHTLPHISSRKNHQSLRYNFWILIFLKKKQHWHFTGWLWNVPTACVFEHLGPIWRHCLGELRNLCLCGLASRNESLKMIIHFCFQS